MSRNNRKNRNAAPLYRILACLLVGGLVLLNGIVNLAQALDQKRRYYNRWVFSLAMAILTIVLGGLIMLNPFSTMEMLVVAIGIIIIYNGVSNLLIELGYRKIYR